MYQRLLRALRRPGLEAVDRCGDRFQPTHFEHVFEMLLEDLAAAEAVELEVVVRDCQKRRERNG